MDDQSAKNVGQPQSLGRVVYCCPDGNTIAKDSMWEELVSRRAGKSKRFDGR